MKKLSLCLVSIMVLCLMLTGCGSLDRDLSCTQLTQADMDYAKGLESSWMKLSIDSYPTGFVTDKTSNKFLFIPPVVYLKSFGTGNSEYGLLDILYVFPLYASVKGSQYDSKGRFIATMSMGYYAPLFAYSEGKNSSGTVTANGFSVMPIPIVNIAMYKQFVAKKKEEIIASRYEFLTLPILGSCFATREGPKTGIPTFLWIPYGREE